MTPDSSNDKHLAFLLLGGNLNDREKMLTSARMLIEKYLGPVLQLSSIYESAPWGFQHNTSFLNQVVKTETSLTPHQLLKKIHDIEELLGRKRAGKGYEARTIDIDILFYDDVILHDPDLIIPHPKIPQRMFTLIPLAEIAGDMMHPGTGTSITELREKCTDPLAVSLFKASENTGNK